MHPQTTSKQLLSPVQRIRIWYVLLLLLGGIFIVRLFYLQVIQYDHYQKAALQKQLKEYEIPAERGVIEAHSGDGLVPIVLNETLYTLFADPIYVKDTGLAAAEIQKVIGGDQKTYEDLLKTPETRYVVLGKRLSKEQHEAIDKLELKGIGTREASYRTYPQGTLAAQLLGFVDNEGEGQYGLEQALNDSLKGTPGQLKAITDAQGVPLASNKDNVLVEPQKGARTVLTIDIGMQQQLEGILKDGLEKAQSKSGSALIIDVETGAIKAMANYPTYNPSEFYKVEDASVFNNRAVSAPLEIGSVMKPLTAAAALDLGVVSKHQTYYDPSFYRIDGATVSNIEEDGGAGTRSIADILQLSLNTGATWLLMQMGGGELNEQARVRWHDYMTNHYRFGQLTGVEQGYESGGTIPDPKEGYGLNIQYANTSFGQGMTATPLQLGAAMSAVLNGGTYYKPQLVETMIHADGTREEFEPTVVKEGVVKPEVGRTIQEFMELTVAKNYPFYGMSAPRSEFSIGGKTGTAEVPKPDGGYYDDRFNGMFVGFVGGNKPQYVIVTRVDTPKVPGYAGSTAAAPIFGAAANMLIDNFSVTPRN